MYTKTETWSIQKLITLAISGKLNPDPIGQRPPTAKGHTKSIQIVTSMLKGFGIGMITLRDISQDAEAQELYPGVDYLVIDGGHRIRALVLFYKNKFAVDFEGEQATFAQIDDLDLEGIFVPMSICVCTPQEATALFQAINTTTPVNFMEMIMSDDVSEVCKQIRSRTKRYKEYDNLPLPVFSIEMDQRGDVSSSSFDMEPNHRRKWDEYVAIAMIKANGGGNVDSGKPEIEALVQQESVGKLDVVDCFFEDAQKIRSVRGKKFNTDVFAALLLVWFGLYGENRKFKIDNHRQFAEEFMYVYSKLKGNADRSLEAKTIEFNGQRHFLKEFFRRNSKNFSNGLVQTECFDQFMLLTSPEKLGVLYRDVKRSLTSDEREERLALQNYKCAIDGLPLELADSVWGHDTAWAKGGDLEDGAVIRRSHNTDMGSTTLEEYKMILELRKKKVA